eukprot:1154044-Pelagomonas_calceolata.AAC.1
MPQDKDPEWDSVTVAEPDEAEGKRSASCAITNMPQAWRDCTVTCACSSAPRTCSSWGRLRLKWLWRRRMKWGRRRGVGGKTGSRAMRTVQSRIGAQLDEGGEKLETKGPGRYLLAPFTVLSPFINHYLESLAKTQVYNPPSIGPQDGTPCRKASADLFDMGCTKQKREEGDGPPRELRTRLDPGLAQR